MSSKNRINYSEEFRRIFLQLLSWFSHARIRGFSAIKETKEIEQLYKSVLEIRKHSPFDGLDIPELARICSEDAITELGLKLDQRLLTPFYETAEKLAEYDGVSSKPQIDFSKEKEFSELIGLKRYLKHLEKIYEGGDKTIDLWVNYVIAMFRSILDQLPVDFVLPEGGQNLFKVDLGSLLNNPAESIEYIFSLIYKEELLFQDLREQLIHNLLMASGIEVSEANTTSKEPVFPTNSKLDRDELIRSFLQYTDLLDIFHYPLQFNIPLHARIEHCHVVGGTGHGKTQLLQTLILDDIRSKRGFCVIDSQGDLINKLSMLKCFVPGPVYEIISDIILVDPTDVDFPVCLNMFSMNLKGLEGVSSFEKERLINATVDLYSYMFGALFGAELTQKQGVIFRYLAKLMMEIPGASIQTLRDLMEDGKKYKPYMGRLSGSARAFFETQFFSKSFVQTKKQVLTRLWGVLSNSTLERMFSHIENKIDIFEAMNSGKSVLINTSKDLLGRDGSRILGRFFVALLGQAILRRTSIPEDKREPFFIYIDEAHEYFDEKIDELLNQARKYKVGITLAHQNLNQLSPSLKATLMSSTSVKLVGGVNSADASQFAREMHTTSENILGVKKNRKFTEFACWIKNTTPVTIPLTVPFGLLEKEPILSQEEYTRLYEKNRENYCIPVSELSHLEDSTHGRRPSIKNDREIETKLIEERSKISKQSKSETKITEKTESTSVIPTGLPPISSGKGSSQHKYLQNLVKKLANDRGFKAVTERPVFDGHGSIDISLERVDTKIAVEISVSTGIEWEKQNISKCLSANYDHIVIIAPDSRQLVRLQGGISQSFPDEVRSQKILFHSPDSFIEYMNELKEEDIEQSKTIKGYKVKSSFSALSPKEEKTKKDAIAKVIVESMKRMKNEQN